MMYLSESSRRSEMKRAQNSLAPRLVVAALSLALCACSTTRVECPKLPSNLLIRPKPLNDLGTSGTSQPEKRSRQTGT